MNNKKYAYLLIALVLLVVLSSIIVPLTLNDSKATGSHKTLDDIDMTLPTKRLDTALVTTKINQLLNDSFSEDELQRLSLSLVIPEYEFVYDFNAMLEYLNASTIKVPLNMYIYELALNDPSILTSQLEYTIDHYEEGSGIMQDSELGTYFTIQTLLTNSIRYSDNIATNMLLDAFISDLTRCTELVPYFGDANYVEWLSTSQNKIQALTYLYNHQEQFTTLLHDMEATVNRSRIPQYLPDLVVVANKTGDINATIHDYALVFDNQSVHYLITLSMDYIEDGDHRMALLSRYIYDIIQESLMSQ